LFYNTILFIYNYDLNFVVNLPNPPPYFVVFESGTFER